MCPGSVSETRTDTVPMHMDKEATMTRTAVRRHVDIADGQLVIRKIVVETSECREVAPAAEILATAPAETSGRAGRLRSLRPGKYAVRIRETHLI